MIVVTAAFLSVLFPVLGVSGAGVLWTLVATAVLAAAITAPPLPTETERGDVGDSLVGLLPAGALAAVFVASAASLVLSTIAPNVLSNRTGALVAWAIAVLVTAAFGIYRGQSIAAFRSDGPAGLLGLAVLAVGLGVALVQPFEQWSRLATAGSDFARHLVLMGQVVDDGGLNYATEAYPRGLHAWIAWTWTASGGESFASGWQALESTMWLLVSLVALASALVGVRLLRMLGIRSCGWHALAMAVFFLAFIQSAWVTAMFRIGFATSLLAGLVLATALASVTLNGGEWLRSTWSLGWISMFVAVLAQSWAVLMPTMMVLALVALFSIGRDWRANQSRWHVPPGLVAVFALAALVAAPPLVAQFASLSATDALAASGFSGLYAPQWWWYGAMGIALGLLVVLWRSGKGLLAGGIASLYASGALMVVYAAMAGPGPAGEMNYYAGKTLWTLSVLILPLSIVGLVAALACSVQRLSLEKSSARRIVGYALVAGVVTLLVAGTMGRMSAGRSEALRALRGATGVVPYALPMMAELEARRIDGSAESLRGSIVWGIAPMRNTSELDTLLPGVADLLAHESTAWLDLTALGEGPLNDAMLNRNVALACDYLRANPDAVRITGPDPSAGAPWLIDGGCPAEVVRPDEWISIPITEEWKRNTRLELLDNTYPTYQELRQSQS
jgi:hypothetical protein